LKKINKQTTISSFPPLIWKEEEEARGPRKENEKHGGRIFSSNKRSWRWWRRAKSALRHSYRPMAGDFLSIHQLSFSALHVSVSHSSLSQSEVPPNRRHLDLLRLCYRLSPAPQLPIQLQRRHPRALFKRHRPCQ